jgi:hypothetical protein
MSRTLLYAAGPSGDMVEVAEFANAFRGAMFVWLDFARRRLGVADDAGIGSLLCNMAAMQEVWDLGKAPSVPRHERIVMCSTFDNVACRAEDFPELIAAFRRYTREFGGPFSAHCSLGEQADAIERLPAGTRAIGWQQTSVTSNPWAVPDGDESRPFNIDRDPAPSWLFDLVAQGGPPSC